MESITERDVCPEARRRIPHMNSVSDVERHTHRGFRREAGRHIDAILNADLQTARDRIGLRTIVYLQLQSDEVARRDADDEWHRFLYHELRADVERARRCRKCDVRARASAVDAELNELVRKPCRHVAA